MSRVAKIKQAVERAKAEPLILAPDELALWDTWLIRIAEASITRGFLGDGQDLAEDFALLADGLIRERRLRMRG